LKYELCKNVMTDDKKRKGFDALIKQTFKLSFEKWYQNGEWGDWNQPYTLYDGEKAIANITVNHMKVLYKDKIRDYIQLGGVVTDPEYRGQGLSRLLMKEVQNDWKNKCDAMFLMANKRVTEFYPKFGFVEESQYRCIWKNEKDLEVHNRDLTVRKLDLSQKEDKEILLRCYEKRNPFSKFQFIDNSSLLQFYCYYGMDACMYYLKEEDAVVVAEYDQDKILCYDIYYKGNKSLLQIMAHLWNEGISEIDFLFTPIDKQGLQEQKYFDEDTHLFVLSGKENVFSCDKLYVPDISHT